MGVDQLNCNLLSPLKKLFTWLFDMSWVQHGLTGDLENISVGDNNFFKAIMVQGGSNIPCVVPRIYRFWGE